MKKILLHSLLISFIGVFVIDYFSHLFFSSPMETTGYFIGKMIAYFLLSALFFKIFNLYKNEFIKVSISGIIIASLWGMYYNVFPLILDYYPAGIALNGLSFLGLGTFGTGLAFGIVHVLAFVGGYFISKTILSRF